MPKSDLPFGSEFSPAQIELPNLLDLAKKHGGDWKVFERAVKSAYFEEHDTSDYNRGKLANNTKLAMQAYGIIDKEAVLTDVGRDLYTSRTNEAQLYKKLARHILQNLHGLTLVQCVLDMQVGGEKVDLVKLREWLEERGISFPRGGKHPSIMRLWLEKAGVFSSGWNVNEEKLTEMAGISSKEVDLLAQFTAEQRAYLKTLANISGKGPFPSNDIEKLATATLGVKFNEKNLPKQVLYPLREAGYITLTRGTKEDGRGAKPFMVLPAPKLVKEIVNPIIEQLEKQLETDIRPLLRKPLNEILEEVDSKDRHIRGLALEALAFKLMRLLDLQYLATRLRGDATGGAEVDLVFESSRLVYSRWQVQCKNTARVALDDVAKEVGLTHFLKSNVIVMVSTGEIGPEARRYANKIMTDSNLCIVMINSEDIVRITENPSAIVDVFNREAKQAMKLKTLELK